MRLLSSGGRALQLLLLPLSRPVRDFRRALKLTHRSFGEMSRTGKLAGDRAHQVTVVVVVTAVRIFCSLCTTYEYEYCTLKDNILYSK